MQFSTTRTTGAIFSAARTGGTTQIELGGGPVPARNIDNMYIRVLVANTSENRDNYFVLPTGMSYNDGAWHHLAVVRTAGTDLNVYLDGVLLIRRINFNSLNNHKHTK